MFYLDDATGRMEGRLWLENANDDEEASDRGIRCVDFILPYRPFRSLLLLTSREQTYVRVTGVLKTFGNKRYINATNIRPCEDPHEVYFHMMEVVYVTLALQRGHVRSFPTSFRIVPHRSGSSTASS